jgi:hypothetical protein
MFLFFLFFILKSIGMIATSTHDSSKLVLLLSTLAVSGTVHYFGLKKEKLSHVIYLFNLKNDLEIIELNQRKNQHENSSTFN